MDSDKRFLLKYVAHVLILLICSICIWKTLWSVIDLILFKEIVSWILLILFSIFIFSYWNWPEVHGLNHCYVHRGSSVWSYCWVISFFFLKEQSGKNCLDVFTHLIAVIYKYEYWHTACEEKNLCVCEDTRSNFFAKRNSSRNYLSKKMVQYLVTLSL